MSRTLATGFFLLLLTGTPVAGQDWVATNPLCPADLVHGDEFGSAVAVGSDWIAIGAYRKNVVYLFHRDGSSGCAPVTTIPGPAADGWFGFDLAMDGNRLLVGAPSAERTGAAYLIELQQDGSLRSLRRLAIAGALPDDEIGSSVAINGNILAIGARGAASGRGRVYVGAEGSLRAVPPPDRLAERAELGQSVALSGSTLVMGAPVPYRGSGSPGVAYVVELGADGSPRSPVPLRLPPELEAEAAFGYSVAIDAGRILVGAPLADRGGTDAGAVYRFERSGTSWELVAQPVRVGEVGDQLGVAVALDGTTAVIGARYAHGERRGAAYVHGMAGGSQELPPPLKAGAEFGFSVAIDDGMVVVGAFREDGGAGAAYRFEAAVQVGFERPASVVLESAATAALDIVVIRPPGGTSPVTFDLEICPPEEEVRTATPLEDFVPPESTYTIPASETRLRIAVPIVSDDEGEGAETFTVRLLPRFPAGGRTPTLHRVTIDDNTYLVVTPGPLTTREDGTSATVEVRLSASPSAAVTVSFTSTDPTEGTVSPSQLTFAAGDQELTPDGPGQRRGRCALRRAAALRSRRAVRERGPSFRRHRPFQSR